MAGAGNGITTNPSRARRGQPRLQTRYVLYRVTAPALDPTLGERWSVTDAAYPIRLGFKDRNCLARSLMHYSTGSRCAEEARLQYAQIYDIDNAIAVEVGVQIDDVKEHALEQSEVDHVDYTIVVQVSVAWVAVAVIVCVSLARTNDEHAIVRVVRVTVSVTVGRNKYDLCKTGFNIGDRDR